LSWSADYADYTDFSDLIVYDFNGFWEIKAKTSALIFFSELSAPMLLSPKIH
jgi:hypothetical protein